MVGPMIYTIDIDPTHPSIEQEVELDGTTYLLTMRWSERDEYWYLSVSALDGTVIAPSRRMVAGSRFLWHAVDFAIRPLGELLVDVTPTRTSLGGDASLIYMDAESVAAL